MGGAQGRSCPVALLCSRGGFALRVMVLLITRVVRAPLSVAGRMSVRRTTFARFCLVDARVLFSCAVGGTSFLNLLYGCPDENPRQLIARAIPIAHVVGLTVRLRWQLGRIHEWLRYRDWPGPRDVNRTAVDLDSMQTARGALFLGCCVIENAMKERLDLANKCMRKQDVK